MIGFESRTKLMQIYFLKVLVMMIPKTNGFHLSEQLVKLCYIL